MLGLDHFNPSKYSLYHNALLKWRTDPKTYAIGQSGLKHAFRKPYLMYSPHRTM